MRRLPIGLASSILAVRRARPVPVSKGMRNPGVAEEATNAALRMDAFFARLGRGSAPGPAGVADQTLHEGSEDGGYIAVVDRRAEHLPKWLPRRWRRFRPGDSGLR